MRSAVTVAMTSLTAAGDLKKMATVERRPSAEKSDEMSERLKSRRNLCGQTATSRQNGGQRTNRWPPGVSTDSDDRSTSSEEGTRERKRKRKASSERSEERKRAKVVPEAEAGTSSEKGRTRRRRKVQEYREGQKKRTSLRLRLLEQQAASSSATTSRECSTPSEEPTRKRKRKASPERSVERKRAKVVPEAEAGTSSENGRTRRRKKVPEYREGRKKRTSLRRRLLDQQAALSSATTSRECNTPSEEPTRKRKRKASPERSVERKRARVVPEAEAGTSSENGRTRRKKKVQEYREGRKKRTSLRRRLLDPQATASSETTNRDCSKPPVEPSRKRKRKASPERSVERKRARVVPEAEAGTSSKDGRTKRRKKVREDGEGPKKRKSLRRRLLDPQAPSSSATTGRQTSSDPLEGCSQRGDRRKAADAAEAPRIKRRLQPVQEEKDREELSEEEQRAHFDSKYEEQYQLGAGGCGSVFAGLRKSDSLPVAIKHVPKDNVLCKHVDQNGKEQSIEVAAMLRIQAGTAGSAGMSAPISLLDWYDLGQELILILERPVPSQDLFDYVAGNGGSLEEQDAKIILKQLVDAAIDLEEKGIFHRDIKSENILIETGSEVPRVRLIDFGLSCFVQKGSYHRTFYGTANHAPPEVHCSRPYRAGPTTVFQMGIVLFDMLHRYDKFETTRYFGKNVQISDELSEDCQDFLEKCLTMIPARRPKLTALLHHPWLR